MTRSTTIARVAAVCMALSPALAHEGAHAQEAYEEEPDPTRLDVERLPPEALEVTRDMFEQGLYLSGQIGGRGFIGGAGRLLQPGVLASVRAGYEFASFLMLAAGIEVSMHETSGPAPPSPTTVELIDLLLELRLQLPLSARAALWLSGEGGVDWVGGNYLQTHGIDASDLDLMYGGSLGFDWHLLSRHHSLGLLAGARSYNNLRGSDGEQSLGVHSYAYLKYVF